ncbi:C3 and PZP-like alpha-2-macroglobulin domain-containing protein 8 isoform X4 [Rhodnius prolixus]|uniref:C3 and PZP-like alpha-2-macroglobulin domain-containing protein 8 isoform X4 n=1 Tax=Rhodnius prolixus TaxID=13249 RepID=UPI003D1892A8
MKNHEIGNLAEMILKVLYIVSLLPFLTLSAEQCSRLSIVSPEVAVPGQQTVALVSLNQQDSDAVNPVNITLRLISAQTRELLAQNTSLIEGEGAVSVTVPKRASGPAYLECLSGCDQSGSSCVLQTSSPLSLVGPVRDVIIRPRSKYYKPGENIEFWLLALDHDLHVSTDLTGCVYVKDPTGTKVAIWQDLPLDYGVKGLELNLSPEAPLGLWHIEVDVDGSTFMTVLNVSLSRGSTDPVIPELPIAEEHYVELSFSHEMRRRYKPGLPFVGKVEAVSSEKAVRVRVKVLDNTTSIYSQDIEMSGGQGSFLVPAILSDSDLITLQAELVSVGGKEIDSHYVLAREPVYKWNSTSACYLLVEGLQAPLKPGDEAHAVILSSCPCDRDLHYLVTTQGHVTFWNEKKISAVDLPPEVNINGASVCRFNFTFKVSAAMAPVSHLLVYYVTDGGEPISDVISFDVKLLQKEVTVNLEQKKFWYPDEMMDVEILSDLDSLVCLVGGRGAEQRFTKMSGGVELDFTEAGVGFYQKDCTQDNIWQEIRGHRPPTKHSVMSDQGLDQLWLWSCFNYTVDIEARGVQIGSPPEPGKWSLWALSVSPSLGLRFSSPISITVFQPLEVDFRLPAAFRVGESLEVDIKIGNNLNSCIDVNALLTLSSGAHFLGSSQPFVAEKLRLGPHGATSLVVRVVATTPKIKNMTVEVSAYHSDTCQSVVSEVSSNHSLVGTLVKQRSIIVHPEGLIKTHMESAYFCANEQMVISTASDFTYEFIPAPRNREGIVLEVRSGKAVHFALSEDQEVTNKMYQVIIGDQDNSISWIGRGKHGYTVHLYTTSTPHILSSDESRTFWLSWDRSVISFGRGPVIHEQVVLKWKIDKKMKVNFIGLATAWGQSAEFRIWNYNDEAGFSQVIHLDIPRSVLPGSETGTLLVAGGLYLPYLSIVPRPTLDEYSSLATIISKIAPLLMGEKLKSLKNHTFLPIRKDLLKELGSSIQNLLLFKKSDSSFSDHHYMTSHWNTVEVLDLLANAQNVIGVDPELVNNIKQWVHNHQEGDGSFRAQFIDLVPDNITGMPELTKTIATTADTLATLINVGVETENDSAVLAKAKKYLETHVESRNVMDGCTLAVLSYALVLSKSDLAPIVLERLKNASTNEEGEFGWPRPKDNSDWLYEEGAEQKKQPVYTHLEEFKASLYTLMTYTLLADLKAAEPVARYLFYRSNILDTHSELIYTAVKAFSQFSVLALDQNRWLTISLATSGMELTDTLELRGNTPPQLLSLPSLPTKVFVYATGGGCATVQGRISYATYSPSRSNALLDLWAGVTNEIMPRRNSIQELEGKLPVINLKVCFKWKSHEVSGVIRIEVHLFSGFEVMSVNPNEFEVNYGSRGDRVWFVVSNVTSSCAVCIEFSARSEYIIGRLRPAFARVYPAGRADLAAELFFHTHKGSPLLAETSDDDLITWFGTNRAGESDGLSSDFSDICACGEYCPDAFTTRTSPTTAPQLFDNEDLRPDDANDFTDIIVFSDLHENLSTTEGELRIIEDITKELGFNSTTGGFTVEDNNLDNFSILSTTSVRLHSPTTDHTISTPALTTPRSPQTVANSEPKVNKKKALTFSRKRLTNKQGTTKAHHYPSSDLIVVTDPAQYTRMKHIDLTPKPIFNMGFKNKSLAPTIKPKKETIDGRKSTTKTTNLATASTSSLTTSTTNKHASVLNGITLNKELQHVIKEISRKPIINFKVNLKNTAEIAKEEKSEQFLEHDQETVLDILREEQTEGYAHRIGGG